MIYLSYLLSYTQKKKRHANLAFSNLKIQFCIHERKETETRLNDALKKLNDMNKDLTKQDSSYAVESMIDFELQHERDAHNNTKKELELQTIEVIHSSLQVVINCSFKNLRKKEGLSKVVKRALRT